MPRVPRQETRPVGAYQQIGGVGGDAFGVGNARALQNAGRAVGGVGDAVADYQVKERQTSLKEAELEYRERARALLYGNEDRPGYFSSKAKDALDNVAPTTAELQKIKESVLERYDSVRSRLEPVLGASVEGDTLSVMLHRNQQQDVYLDQLSEARIGSAAEDASNFPDLRLPSAQVIVEQEVIDRADRNGWSPEVTQWKLEEARTALYASVIRASIQRRDSVQTETLLEELGPRMDSRVVAQLREQSNQLRLTNQSQEALDAYLAAGLTEEQAIDRARKDFSGTLRDEVVRRVNNEWARKQRAETRALKEAQSNVRKLITGGLSADQALARIDEDGQDRIFRDGSLDEFYGLERTVAENKLYAPASDGKSYARLKGQETRDLAETDPTQFLGILTRSEHGQLITDVASARRRLEKGSDVARSVLNNAEADVARDLKGDKAFFRKGKPTEAFNRLITDLRNFVYDRVDQTGKPPSDREVKAFTARKSLGFEGDTSVFPLIGSFEDVPGSELTERQKAVATVPLREIPRDLFTDVAEAVNARGIAFPELPKEDVEALAASVALGDQERFERILGQHGAISGISFAQQVAQVESGGNPNAQSSSSSATGLYQFIDRTWLQIVRKHEPELLRGRSRQEVLGLRTDPAISTRMFEHFARENTEALESANILATPVNLYLAHFLGATGAIKALNSDRSRKVANVLGGRVVEANEFLRGMTIGDLVNWAERKINGHR